MPSDADLQFLRTLSELAYCNPFQPERLELERQALGSQFRTEDQIAWSRDFRRDETDRPNVEQLTRRAEHLVDRLRDELDTGEHAGDEKFLSLYRDQVYYVVYYRHVATFDVGLLVDGGERAKQPVANAWQGFSHDLAHYLQPTGGPLPQDETPERLFAFMCQMRRAFRFTFDDILGDSRPAAELRATVWQSVFTHDMRRYRRSLFDRMRDLTTLITGPSGTGKELVARAIGLSQYIAFDPKQQTFVGELSGAFLPVNLSALSPTLVESELFGHCRGAFTGAVTDRRGWLEGCPPHGAVFLDEIGELDPALQVKLLRVVQSRAYSRIGEVKERRFLGKLVAATNRDLAAEIRAGRFREDLYYRLCSDRIETPSLREHLDDCPESLHGLIKFIAARQVGDEAEALTREVEHWIDQHVGRDYRWPGNIRELEQCVRNVLVRQRYQPSTTAVDDATPDAARQWLVDAEQGTLTFAELLGKYCTWIYARTGSYQRAAELLGIDRRTVRSKIDAEMLAQIKRR
jgi:DNA-binding NtrC family response regulator